MTIRWEQRFAHFQSALKKLNSSAKILKEGAVFTFPEEMQELLQEGLIQRFEYTHELAWKVMKDYAEYQSPLQIAGSRDAIRQAFSMNLISNGELWMQTISERNLTSHTYNQEIAQRISRAIIDKYQPLFLEFEATMISKLSTHDENLWT